MIHSLAVRMASIFVLYGESTEDKSKQIKERYFKFGVVKRSLAK